MSHAFGELLMQYRNRKNGLSQAKLAQIVGYDPAVIARMAQGARDLTGPSGRERVVRIISALQGEGVLHSLEEANALLTSANMPPLYDGLPAEAALIQAFIPVHAAHISGHRPPPVAPAHNLPVLLTSYIGRDHEIAELVAQLQTTRLLMLTGPGGVGKSRLALQVVDEALQRDVMAHGFVDGVWLIQLAPVNDPALIAGAIAAILGLHPSGRSAHDVLIECLRDKRSLLILDNCEHLIQACAEFVEALLRTCPHVRVLATSREPLNIAGEVIWRVQPLIHETAMRLFAERARAVRPGFAVGEHDGVAISQICERLDGVPLSIELAAARLQMFSIEQIAMRLNDRFHLLSDGSRTALPRHRTLRAMIDWSYDLLPEQERALLRQVSAFVGGWTLEMAEVMSGSADALNDLAQLVKKSLVNKKDETLLDVRYSLHETIRQYAHEKLIEHGELDAIQRRHAMACLALVTKTHTTIQSVDQQRWVSVLETERANIHAALAWSLSESGDLELGAHIAFHLGDIWLQNHRQEGLQWMRRLVKVMPASLPLMIRGAMMLEYAYLLDTTRPPELWEILGQLREMYAHEDPESPQLIEVLGYQALLAATAIESCVLMDEAVAISLRSPQHRARYWIHYYLGLHLGPLRWRLDMAGAKATFAALLQVATEERDIFGQALAYEGMMHVAFYELKLAQATELAGQALALAQLINAEMPTLSALHCLAEIALMEGRLDAAKTYIDASHTHNAKYGHLSAAAQWVGLRMRLALLQGDDMAVLSGAANLRAFTSVPDVWTLGNASTLFGVETLAAFEASKGRYAQATHLFGAAEAERERRHNPWWPKDHTQLDPYIDASRQCLGEAAFARTWTEGRSASLDRSIALALDEGRL